MIPSAIRPLRNPMSVPTAALKACAKVSCIQNSTIRTAINGKIRIPNGGKMNVPAMMAIVAVVSPILLPPNLLTAIDPASRSASRRKTVSTPIDTQKTQVRTAELVNDPALKYRACNSKRNSTKRLIPSSYFRLLLVKDYPLPAD